MEEKYIVIGNGYEYVEAVAITANSKEDAIMTASKKMKADEFILAERVDKLDKFRTNTHSSRDGWNYIAQLGSTVKIGFITAPYYNRENPPHIRLEICAIINFLINPFDEEEVKHVILGKRLPDTTISTSCYYCGNGCTEAYF